MKELINQVWAVDHSIIAVVIVALSILLGIVVEKLLMPIIRRVGNSNKYLIGNALVHVLNWKIAMAVIYAGCMMAINILDLPDEALNFANKFLGVFLIAWVTLLIRNTIVEIFKAITKTANDSRDETILPATSILNNVFKVLVVLIGFLLALNFLGIEITPILTALGVGGLAVALALQDTLGNLFAGLQIIASRKLTPGDYIKLNSGEEGYVQDVAWRHTSIKNIDGNFILIPNSVLGGSIVTNYYQNGKNMVIHVINGVAYGSDLYKVESITNEVANEIQKTVPGANPDFKPFMFFTSFGDSNINFDVRLQVIEFSGQYKIASEFIKLLHHRYLDNDIEISWPVRVVHHKSTENNGTIEATIGSAD